MFVKPKLIKYLPLFFLGLFISLGSTIFSSRTAYAIGVSEDIYVDDDGNFCYKVIDSKLTTRIGYETQGFTIHQDVDGVRSDTNYIGLVFSPENTTSTDLGNGKIETVKRFTAAQMESALTKIDPTGALLNNYKTGTGILHFEGIMRTFKVGNNGVRIYSGDAQVDSDGFYAGENGKLYGFVGNTEFSGDMYSIMNAYSWNDKAAFLTHYNKILPFMHAASDGTQIPTLDADKISGSTDVPGMGQTGGSGKTEPDVYTWHSDETYDVGEGIPSGESFVSHYWSDKWYGTYTWELMPTVQKDYTVTFIYEGTWTRKYWYQDGEKFVGYNDDGTERKEPNIVEGTSQEHFTYTKDVPVTRKAAWYALRNVNIKELAKITVTNDSYGAVTYNVGSSVSAQCIINGETLATYQDNYETSMEKHVEWPENAENQEYSGDWGVRDSAPSEGEVWASVGDLSSLADDVVGDVTSWNDLLVVEGHTYMENTRVTAKDTNSLMPEPVDIADGDYGELTDQKDVTIPVTKDNGKYDTTLEAMYEGVVANDRRTESFTKSGTEAILDGAGPGDEYDNKSKEPVVVHTPVVSPVTIKDKSGSAATTSHSQVPSTNADGRNSGKWNDKLTRDGITSYDLLLDEKYTIEFDPYEWLSETVREMSSEQANNDTVKTETNPDGKDGYDLPGYGTSLYDKYVKSRQVRFPFDVMVVSKSTGEETYYDCNDDYTPWITIDSNSVDIYIPTWAEESEVRFGHANQSDYYKIQFKVEAQNVNSHTSATEDLSNKNLDNYVATFDVPVSISGWIYDFTITGTSDSDMYSGYDNTQIDKTEVAFAMTKDEKKTGTKNRLGDTIWRYLIDGLTHNVSSENPSNVTAEESRKLIPLRNGSSETYSSMGALWKGAQFSYSVKSISSLTKDTDKVVIVPSLRYYDKNGDDITSDVKMYYTRTTSSGEQQYVEVGSSRDTLTSAIVQSVKLGSTQFDGARFQGRTFLTNDTDVPSTFTLPDFATYTATKQGLTLNQLLERKTDSYSVSEISISARQRLFSGCVEELARNSSKSRLDDSIETTYSDGKFEDNEEFTQSMQTWYGQYQIPNEFYVTKDTRDLDTISYDGKLSKDSDIWEKGGYIVVNFQIYAVHDGNYSLAYKTSTQNMWETQGQLKKATINVTDSDGKITKKTIDLQDGDVAIYDLSYSVNDKIGSHIHSISQ